MINKRGVMFLDYDGVVNNVIWDFDKNMARYNFPDDGCVNDLQAVRWISQICEDFGMDVVVTSSWRLRSNYKECLLNAGFKGGNIIGRTPVLLNSSRSEEISEYLKEHPDIEEYVIVDDESFDFDDCSTLCNHFHQVKGDGFYYTDFCELTKLIINLRSDEYLKNQSQI